MAQGQVHQGAGQGRHRGDAVVTQVQLFQGGEGQEGVGLDGHVAGIVHGAEADRWAIPFEVESPQAGKVGEVVVVQMVDAVGEQGKAGDIATGRRWGEAGHGLQEQPVAIHQAMGLELTGQEGRQGT